MGRPPLPEGQAKDEWIHIRVNAHQKRLMVSVWKLTGWGQADILMRHLAEWWSKKLNDKNINELAEAQQRYFMMRDVTLYNQDQRNKELFRRSFLEWIDTAMANKISGRKLDDGLFMRYSMVASDKAMRTIAEEAIRARFNATKVKTVKAKMKRLLKANIKKAGIKKTGKLTDIEQQAEDVEDEWPSKD